MGISFLYAFLSPDTPPPQSRSLKAVTYSELTLAGFTSTMIFEDILNMLLGEHDAQEIHYPNEA